VALRGGYRLQHIDRLVREIEPLALAEGPVELRLDLTGLAFVTPTAFTALAAVLADRGQRQLLTEESRWYPPRSPVVDRYLSRMNFHRFFTTAEHQGEAFKRRPPVGFLPCRRITSEKGRDEAIDALAQAASDSLALAPQDEMQIWFAVRELCNNVIDHAHCGSAGFAMAQSGKRRNEFELAIADGGVGVRRSLTSNPDYAHIESDLQAIEQAVRLHVTARPRENAGTGLNTIRQAVEDNGGALLIRSGTASILYGERHVAQEGLPTFPGTLVALRIRRDREFKLSRFGELGTVDRPGSAGAGRRSG
jgi:hypothetical protein